MITRKLFKVKLKSNEGTIQALRGALIVLFTIAINFASFSQTVNAITTGYHNCYVGDSLIDKHTDRAKAVTHCVSLQAANPDKLVGFTYPDFTRIEVSGVETIAIDTIQATRLADIKGWIDYTDLGTKPSQGKAYLPFYDYAIIDFYIDTIYNWQSKYNFKRIKEFGKTTYEQLDIPFQFMDIWSDGNKLWFNISEKQVRITSWIDGVLFKEFIPGSSNEILNGWEFYFTVPDEGNIVVEIENAAGKIITYKTMLRI